MRALAVDPSKSAGLAHGLLGAKPISETVTLAGHDGVRFTTLEARIRHVIEANQIEHVFMERVFISSKIFSMDHTCQACGYQAAVRMACERSGLSDAITLVSAAEWRSSAGLRTQAPKEIKDAARRKWLKEQSINRCLEFGWSPRNDNEADALLIWAYAESLHSQLLSNVRLPVLEGMVTI